VPNDAIGTKRTYGDVCYLSPFGVKADLGLGLLYPLKRTFANNSICPLSAISGPSASQQIVAYSITSSARKSIEVGSSTPIAFAVFKLTIISNFEACSTGSSAGFVPFKIFAT
jgi:hypothetical protein